jgi:hypothetical protein
MKHYYSIANFITGIVTNGYDYLFKDYRDNGTNYINQQLFGQLTTYLKGYDVEQKLKSLIDGINPVDFQYQWNNTTIKYIAGEYENYYILNGEYSTNWSGEARNFIINKPWVKLISD